MLKVHSLESMGTFDGPGIRLVVFLQGCNFKCLYCANADTIPINGGNVTEVEEVVALAVRQKPFFGKKGGVTVSGGEPLLQADELSVLFKRLHEEGINTCVDSNGSVFNNSVKELLEYTDLVLLDIKHIDSKTHLDLTGRDNRISLDFSEYLREKGISVWMRYVLVPGLTDNPEFLKALGKRFQDFDNIVKLEIQPYHSLGIHKYEYLGMDYKLKGVKENTKEQLEVAYNIFSNYFKEVVIN